MPGVNLAALFEGAGLPRPDVEHQFAAPDRKWAFDAAFVPWRVALEIQGGIWTHGRHTRGRGYLNDREKINEAQLRGWIVLELSPEQLESGEAFALVERALTVRGWQITEVDMDIYEAMRQQAVQLVRDTWEKRRPEMRRYLVAERGFNPRAVDKCVTSYIDSIVYAAEETSKVEAARARQAAGRDRVTE